MLKYGENYEKCPYCKKDVKFYIADTPAVCRVYCPVCLKDIEVTWKER